MSKIWGPMGWITLHAIAISYPENPTLSEKQNMKVILELFTDTLTCRYCKDHFSRILNAYNSQYPNFLNSKHEFFIFTLRAHNEVNRSLDKPIINSVTDCLQMLKNATQTNTPTIFKDNYMSYLIRVWAHEMTGDALIYKSKSITMRDMLTNINLDNCFNLEVKEDDITSFKVIIQRRISPLIETLNSLNYKVGFKGGKLKLR